MNIVSKRLLPLLLAASTACSQTVWTVTTDRDENDSPAGAELSLREALRDAAPGDRIEFANSLSGKSLSVFWGELLIDKSIEINASSLEDPVELFSASSSRILRIDDDVFGPTISVTLVGLSFTTGNAGDGNGGAILSSENLTITDCEFGSNQAAFGSALYSFGGTNVLRYCRIVDNDSEEGAIYQFAGSIEIDYCYFDRNESSDAGGALSAVSATVTITDSSFSSHRAAVGGALALSGSSSNVTVEESQFSKNQATTHGGAIHTVAASLTIQSSDFTANEAGEGGVLSMLTGAQATILDSRFDGNVAASNGGVLLAIDSSVEVERSNFGSNRAQFPDDPLSVAGGGAFRANQSEITLENCVFAKNQAYIAGVGFLENNATAVMTNCVFLRNFAFYGSVLWASETTLEVTNATMAANTRSSIAAVIEHANGSLSLHNSLFWDLSSEEDPSIRGGYSGGNNLIHQPPAASFDPRFVRPPDGSGSAPVDLRLLPDSPALNAGDGLSGGSANLSTEDADGRPRFDETIDIGAYEGAFYAFSRLYPQLAPLTDGNDNGLADFGDYATGSDPSQPSPLNFQPTWDEGTLVLHRRRNAVDLETDLQVSPNLAPGSWRTAVEGVDYTTEGTTDHPLRTELRIRPIQTETSPSRHFFRERYTIQPLGE